MPVNLSNPTDPTWSSYWRTRAARSKAAPWTFCWWWRRSTPRSERSTWAGCMPSQVPCQVVGTLGLTAARGASLPLSEWRHFTDIGASGPASEQCIEWYEVVFFKGWHHEYSSCLNPKHIYVYGYNQTNILTLKNNQKIICNRIMVVPILVTYFADLRLRIPQPNPKKNNKRS